MLESIFGYGVPASVPSPNAIARPAVESQVAGDGMADPAALGRLAPRLLA